jgi:hypothetical protein
VVVYEGLKRGGDRLIGRRARIVGANDWGDEKNERKRRKEANAPGDIAVHVGPFSMR